MKDINLFKINSVDNFMSEGKKGKDLYKTVERIPLYMIQDERDSRVKKKILEILDFIGQEISRERGEEYNQEEFPSVFHELTNYNGTARTSGGVYILSYRENPVANILITSNDEEDVYTLLVTLGTLDRIGSAGLEKRISEHFHSILSDENLRQQHF